MKEKIMSERTAKLLVIISAIILLVIGFGLYKVFEYYGFGEGTSNKKIVNYDIKDYVETTPVVFNNYSNVYNKINVSKVNLKNINIESTSTFLNEEEELIN